MLISNARYCVCQDAVAGLPTPYSPVHYDWALFLCNIRPIPNTPFGCLLGVIIACKGQMELDVYLDDIIESVKRHLPDGWRFVLGSRTL